MFKKDDRPKKSLSERFNAVGGKMIKQAANPKFSGMFFLAAAFSVSIPALSWSFALFPAVWGLMGLAQTSTARYMDKKAKSTIADNINPSANKTSC